MTLGYGALTFAIASWVGRTDGILADRWHWFGDFVDRHENEWFTWAFSYLAPILLSILLALVQVVCMWPASGHARRLAIAGHSTCDAVPATPGSVPVCVCQARIVAPLLCCGPGSRRCRPPYTLKKACGRRRRGTLFTSSFWFVHRERKAVADRAPLCGPWRQRNRTPPACARRLLRTQQIFLFYHFSSMAYSTIAKLFEDPICIAALPSLYLPDKVRRRRVSTPRGHCIPCSSCRDIMRQFAPDQSSLQWTAAT